MRDQPVARPLPTHRTTTQNKRTQTAMSRVGLEPTILVFEWTKTVHARAVTVVGENCVYTYIYQVRHNMPYKSALTEVVCTYYITK
jgi:hypothetical protein